MKKITALLLVLALLLCGCGKEPAETQPDTSGLITEATDAPTEETAAEATTESTEAPTAGQTLYTNPLNGEILDAPYTGRVFAVTVSNIPDALPHVGVPQADIFMEMFVNGSIVRGLALYSDITDVEAIGSSRSTRPMFNDIASHYDAVLCHVGGSEQSLTDANRLGIDDFNMDTWENSGYSFRDMDRYNSGWAWEHCLFGIGSGLVAHAQELGMRISQPADKNYNLTFTEDGTPAGGEDAQQITIRLNYGSTHKDTIMKYDAELGKYAYWQYDKMMADGYTGETEAFENVIVMYTKLTMDGGYHRADFVAGGEGYYACGGKLIPIKWGCDSEDQPFWFTTVEGEPLNLGVGNTYIAITSPGSAVTYGA